MYRSKAYRDFCLANENEEEEKEEKELNLQELQELVRDLSKRVAKLECHHAKF